ncbi:mitogen-activated protein kinase kinase [Acrasis kona]|uniref:mitogen-activated protein kinase kinase n=1 Tax=Acrasis kona TaxID=1008807 RepID=A0AAW2Z1B3_9EUKA
MPLTIDVDPDASDDYMLDDNGSFVNGSFAINNQWQDLRLEDLQQTTLLGQGASGVVYKALHRPTGKILALKDISVFDAEKRKQIIKELQTLYSSSCPYLVAFYGAFYSDGSISIALEYMEGGSLADVCRLSGSIPEGILSKIFYQVLQGLRYLHKDKHVVHRDLKPSNILMNESGEFKITDFGVSAEVDNTQGECATFVGTCTYMSPERLEGYKYSFASDIWAIGIAAAECALGSFPFVKDNGTPVNSFWELLSHIKTKEPPQLKTSQGFSPELCDFVNGCLKRNPRERVSVQNLLDHPFIKFYENRNVGYSQWVPHIMSLIEKDRVKTSTNSSNQMKIENKLDLLNF